MIYKYRYLVYTLLGLLLLFMFTLLSGVISNSDSSFAFDQKATKINGVFSTLDAKVYAMVPSNGYYEVKGVKPESFHTLPDNFADAHIGFDQQHVYAGNLILEGLNPASLKPLGNNYFSDGTTTYYCSHNTERNPDLGALKEVFQIIGQRFGLNSKPQSYWYPYVKLPASKTAYQAILKYGIAVDGVHAYYKGLAMPEANPQSMQPLYMRRDGKDDRESIVHFTDGKHVYYQNELLPLSYNTSLHELNIEGDIPGRNTYLIDEQNGMVYVDGLPFDIYKAPYKVLSIQLKHANQVLFAARDGIYFYNAEEKQVERAGSNPFGQNGFKEIAADVFKSGDKFYYLRSREDWGRKSGLHSRKTSLMELKNVPGLHSISDSLSRYGNVWQSGNRYYYFDDLGSSQLMSDAVYEIQDSMVAQVLATSGMLRSDDIRELDRIGGLAKADSKDILTATTPYGNKDRKILYWFMGGAILLALLLGYLLRNKKMPPFVLKDDWLIINNLSFKRYRIGEVDKVLFRIVHRNGRAVGYTGKMQVLRTNGKASWSWSFATRITLLPESEAELRQYITELQVTLSDAGIKSELQ